MPEDPGKAAPRLVAATCTPRATTAAPDATDSGEGADVEMARMARRAAGGAVKTY